MIWYGRVGADLHPVPLRVDQKQAVRGIAGHLPADQRIGVEAQLRAMQRVAILLGDPAHLLRVQVHYLIEPFARLRLLRESLLEEQQDLVAQRPQARGHHEKREARPLVTGRFPGHQALVAGHHARVRNGDQALLHGNSKTEGHSFDSAIRPLSGRTAAGRKSRPRCIHRLYSFSPAARRKIRAAPSGEWLPPGRNRAPSATSPAAARWRRKRRPAGVPVMACSEVSATPMQ